MDSENARRLLSIARASVASSLGQGPEPDVAGLPDELTTPAGAFVTIRKSIGDLRGCIGRFDASEPLADVVAKMARAAAFEDNRFPPVSKDELPDLRFEISILSPLKKISDPYREIEVGTHGIWIKKGFRSGTFLPEVATDHNMDLEEFLSTCASHKAGLPPDSWKNDPEVEIFTYTTEHVKEE